MNTKSMNAIVESIVELSMSSRFEMPRGILFDELLTRLEIRLGLQDVGMNEWLYQMRIGTKYGNTNMAKIIADLDKTTIALDETVSLYLTMFNETEPWHDLLGDIAYVFEVLPDNQHVSFEKALASVTDNKHLLFLESDEPDGITSIIGRSFPSNAIVLAALSTLTEETVQKHRLVAHTNHNLVERMLKIQIHLNMERCFPGIRLAETIIGCHNDEQFTHELAQALLNKENKVREAA